MCQSVLSVRNTAVTETDKILSSWCCNSREEADSNEKIQKISNSKHCGKKKKSRIRGYNMINSDHLNQMVKEVLFGELTTKQRPKRRMNLGEEPSRQKE